MNTDSDDRVEAIFAAALSLRPDEREAYLTEACGDDTFLMGEVRALLNADQAAPSRFLSGPLTGNSEPGTDGAQATPGQSSGSPGSSARSRFESHTESEGDVIGPYKLLQQIGEGGFGTVWMAEQSKPITRKVALKVIKAGMDTREVLARFEAERQALAMMDHPNIARVLDAGATGTGRPYFAMELVQGIPITTFCDEHSLKTSERLALFGDVCAAINHAHQKGVIHRDIKPNNVLVSLHDDKPVVKVIDFGIAKATQGKLTDKTLVTCFEQFIGTPAYMSPEQASLNEVDIDTRSDIYSLGVMLYELLTGKPPFDGKSLISAGYDEMRRIIREIDPEKPSSRLSTVAGEERTRLALARNVESGTLSRVVESDLDWIVMKSIEKERARRYETANAFAQDIARFLADEPVSACPPSASYQFRKFARRNRAGLQVAAVIIVLLVTATTVSSWLAVKASRAEGEATAMLAKVAAERDAKEEALREAEEVSEFFTDMFESSHPGSWKGGRNVKVAAVIDRAVEGLETKLVDQPQRKARLQITLARTYYALGLYDEAIPLLEAARNYYLAQSAPEQPGTLHVMQNLAISYLRSGRLERAISIMEEVLNLRRKVQGNEHPDTLMAMHDLAISYSDAGRFNEALKLREEALTLRRKVQGHEHRETIVAMGDVASSYYDSERRTEALDLREEALALSRRVNGDRHLVTLMAMQNLAISYHEADRRDEALNLREEVLKLRRKIQGPWHADTLIAMHDLAISYDDANRGDEALKIREEVLKAPRKGTGTEDIKTILAMQDLATSYHVGGRREEALEMREEIVDLRRKRQGPKHPATLQAMNRLANSYDVGGRRNEALEIREEGIALRREMLSSGLSDTLAAMDKLAKSYHDVGRRDEALKMQGEAVDLRHKLQGPKHPDTLVAIAKLAIFLRESGFDAKAQAMDRQILISLLSQMIGRAVDEKQAQHLLDLGMKPNAQRQEGDGTWSVDLSGMTRFNDLAIFRGARISRLKLKGTAIADLSDLRGMPLTEISLSECNNLTKLSPLAEAKELTSLILPPSPDDIEFLRSLPKLDRLSYSADKVKTWIADKTSAEFWKKYDAENAFPTGQSE